MTRSRWSAAIAAAAACLALAAPARADTTSIAAPDMEIDVGDAGDLGAGFMSSGFNTLLPSGEAGLQVDFPGAPGTAVGIGEFAADTQGEVTGAGTPGDPFSVATTYHATVGTSTVLQVSQTVTHVTGDPRVLVHLVLTNVSGASLRLRAIEWGDVQGGGFGQGTGTLSGDFLAGVFAGQASATGLQRLTPWDSYEEADDSVLSPALENPDGPPLNDTFDNTELHDPAVAAEYDKTLDPNATLPIDVAWKFLPGAANLDLEPQDGSGPPDKPACFTATVTSAYGTPVPGVAVDFAAGDPHPDQETPTDANGQAAYCVTAAEPDEFLFVEADVTDALLSSFSTWTFTGPSSGGTDGGTSPPSTVRARLVHGKVRIRHGKGWTALTGARALPLGTTLDARHGTVALTATVRGHSRRAAFHGGVFLVRQADPKSPVDIVLGGRAFSACRHGSTRVVRRLAAVARGHFETVGRASTASGSGSWSTQDRCDGTLTSVQTGAVTVRDAHHHHTVVVHARHRALIKP